MTHIKNYINGELVEPAGGAYLDNVDPATGHVYSKVPDSDGADVDRAVAAAAQAFPVWSRMPTAERSAFLLKIADLIEKNIFPKLRSNPRMFFDCRTPDMLHHVIQVIGSVGSRVEN